MSAALKLSDEPANILNSYRDYYRMLEGMIDRLEENTLTARRAVYMSARKVLSEKVAQRDCLLSPAEAASCRLRLDTAIMKLETEQLRRTRVEASGPAEPQRQTPYAAVDNGPVAPRASPSPTYENGANWAEAVIRRHEAAKLEAAGDGSGLSQDMQHQLVKELHWLRRERDPAPNQQSHPVRADGGWHGRRTPEVELPEVERELREPPPKFKRFGKQVFAAGLLAVIGAGLATEGYHQRNRLLPLLDDIAVQGQALIAGWDWLDIAGQPASAKQQSVALKRKDYVLPVNAQAPAPATSAGWRTYTEVEGGASVFERTPEHPNGEQHIGTATWRTELLSPMASASPEPAVRADIDVPTLRMMVTLMFRRNFDQALGASHMVQIVASLAEDGRRVKEIPGILVRKNGDRRSVPLFAWPMIMNEKGKFVIALSGNEADTQINMKLLQESGRMEIPLIYDNGDRALLTIEMGPAGGQAIKQVVAMWQWLSPPVGPKTVANAFAEQKNARR